MLRRELLTSSGRGGGCGGEGIGFGVARTGIGFVGSIGSPSVEKVFVGRGAQDSGERSQVLVHNALVLRGP